MKKKAQWILFVICLTVFVALRLLSVNREPQEAGEKIRPVVPEPVLVEKAAQNLLSHPWVRAQPNLAKVNPEMERDLAAFDELCEALCRQRSDWPREQIQSVLINTLTSIQKQIPFHLPEDLYNVYCISEAPDDWMKPPAPFHVYKRLYLGEMEVGLPFYLDVRVFELGSVSADDVVQWHLEMLDGEPSLLYKSAKRSVYAASGERTRESAHGFAQGERGLFIDCLARDGKLYILYAEAPIKTFKENEFIFKEQLKMVYDE